MKSLVRRTRSASPSSAAAQPPQDHHPHHPSSRLIVRRHRSHHHHNKNEISSHHSTHPNDDDQTKEESEADTTAAAATTAADDDGFMEEEEDDTAENEEEDRPLIDDSIHHKYNHHHLQNQSWCICHWCGRQQQPSPPPPKQQPKQRRRHHHHHSMMREIIRVLGLGILATAVMLLLVFFGHFITTTTTFPSTNNNNHTTITREHAQRPKSILVTLDEKQQRIQLPPVWNNNDADTNDQHDDDNDRSQQRSVPDYGNLTLAFITDPTTAMNFQRRLKRHDDRYLDYYREDLFMQYFEEEEEEEFWGYSDAYRDPRKACVWPERVYTPTTTCNTFHELDFIHPSSSSEESNYNNTLQFLGSGYYRHTWLVRAPDHEYVIKRQNIKRHYDRNRYQKIMTEAFVMEQLTSSTRISDIYGHCGFSIMVEAALYDMDRSIYGKAEFQKERGKIKQEILDAHQIHDVYAFNNYTAHEKLELLIQMTESIADTHGLPTGPVVSGDVAVNQWLLAKDGHRLILNDFDSAVLLAFNFTSRQYCPYSSGFVGGFKAPEERHTHMLDESIDMWKVGCLIFAVLTGLKPYYSIEHTEEKWDAIERGPPYIDPRYETRNPIEARLVQIMRDCMKMDPAKRANIFQVVKILHETKRMYA